MPLVEKRNDLEYDDARARKALAQVIKVHQAKLAELSSMRETIKEAELKLASMQAAIDKTAMSKMRLQKRLQKACGEAPMFPSAPLPGGPRKSATS